MEEVLSEWIPRRLSYQWCSIQSDKHSSSCVRSFF